MSNLSLLPEKYYIIWLDQHIGEAGFCHKLKEAFFTHIGPNDATKSSFIDNEIQILIQNQSETSINFDNVHFTFKAFVEVQSCVQYIRQIHQHRILLIASSILGQPAVEQIIREFPDLFINKLTKKPYHSIYIFCTDIAKVCQWGFEYFDYLLAFDHEADLLERMTNELCKEFHEQAKYLADVEQYEAALERASWSRNVLIHYEDLENKSACRQPEQGKSSKKLREIDELIEQIERQMKTRSDDSSDEVDTTNSEESSVDPIKHRIIYLDELRKYSLDKNQQTATYFSNLPIQLDIYHNREDVLELITGEHVKTMISLVITASDTEKILNKLSSINKPININSIYILGNCFNEIIKLINDYAKMNIQIQVFSIYEKLLSNLLEDISQSYISKGAESDLIYFDWAKELVIRTRQIKEDQINQQLDNINQQKQQKNKLIQQSNFSNNLEQQIRSYLHNEDSDHIIMIFYVQLKIQPIDFDNDLARILSCQTTEQVISLVRKIQLKNPIIIVSTESPSDEVLTLCQLRFYFYLLNPNQLVDNSKQNTSNICYIFSKEHILNELYNKLGEYYRDTAIQLSMESNDQDTPDRLLERSTKCYKLLQNDIEKIIKEYKKILPIE